MYNAVAISFYWDHVKEFSKSHAPDLHNQFLKYEQKSELQTEIMALAIMFFIWLHPIWSNSEHMKYESYCQFLVELETNIEELQPTQPTQSTQIPSTSSISEPVDLPVSSDVLASSGVPESSDVPVSCDVQVSKPPSRSKIPQPKTPAKNRIRKTPRKGKLAGSAKTKDVTTPQNTTIKNERLTQRIDMQFFNNVTEKRLTTAPVENEECLDNSRKSMDTIFYSLKGKAQPYQDKIGKILRQGLTVLHQRVITNNAELLTLRAFCSGLKFGLTNSENEVCSNNFLNLCTNIPANAYPFILVCFCKTKAFQKSLPNSQRLSS